MKVTAEFNLKTANTSHMRLHTHIKMKALFKSQMVTHVFISLAIISH